jgi:hypothetical protein
MNENESSTTEKNNENSNPEFENVVMNTEENKKEAARKKSLGELGELFAIKALVDSGYEKIINLNDKKMNFPFADLYAEKDDERLIISVKARNKFQKDNKLNAFYNLGSNAYKKAALAENEFGAKPYWMAIQFDQFTYSLYFGSLEELSGKEAIPLRQCEKGSLGICLVKDKRHYFDFGFFSNEKNVMDT